MGAPILGDIADQEMGDKHFRALRAWEPLNWGCRTYRRWQSVSGNPRVRVAKTSHAPGRARDSEFQGIVCILSSEKAYWDPGKNCVSWGWG